MTEVITEYRTEENRLLFRVVSKNGIRYISIKHRGCPKTYFVPVDRIGEETSVIEIAPDSSG